MTKLGSQKLHICPRVTNMGSTIGHRIDYNGVGALRGQRHIPAKINPSNPPGATTQNAKIEWWLTRGGSVGTYNKQRSDHALSGLLQGNKTMVTSKAVI